MDNSNKNKYAFIVRTNFTLFNCINILLNEGIVNKADLYIEVMQESMVDTIDKLRDAKLFKNIYIDRVINVKNCKNHLNHFIIKILNLLTFLFPRLYLMLHFGKTCIHNVDSYKNVFTSYIDFNTRNLIMCSVGAELVLYEEGLGTYNNTYGYTNKLKYKFADIIFNVSSLQNRIKRIYLNNIDLYTNNNDYDVKKIKIDDYNMHVCKSIFPEYDISYINSRIIYLQQPYEFKNNYFKCILNVLKEFDRYIIRPHPGERINCHDDFNIDKCSSLWEIICYDCISDDTVLIGLNSTALMTPKTLFNKEPYIVFLYEMAREFIPDALYKNCIVYCNNLRALYNTKYKICIPTTLLDLKEILTKAIN